MKNNVWARTLLFTYKNLEILASSIDKLVEKHALNSFYNISSSIQDNSVMAVTNRIYALMDRKINLINIKVLIEETLEACDQLSAQLLIERYIDGDRSEVVAERLGLPLRTYFRKLQQAEDSFTSKIASRGFTDDKLKDQLKQEKWIMDVYRNFLSKRVGELEELEEAI